MTVATSTIDSHFTFVPGGAVERNRLLDEAGVAAAVLVAEEPDAEASLRAAQETADDARVAALVAWVDPASPDLGKTLDALTGFPKVKGVLVDARAQSSARYPSSDAVVAGLEQVSKRGLSADLLVEMRQINAVTALAGRLPDLRIVLTHLGMPYIGRSEREPWGVAVLNLEACANVSVKASGLVGLDVQDWRTAHLALFEEPVVRLFGVERVLAGSGWPLGSDRASYPQALEAIRSAAGPLSGEQAERFAAGSARAFYRIS
ncbi:MAG: amidohydrolase family protein [Chloroflexota bacterium]